MNRHISKLKYKRKKKSKINFRKYLVLQLMKMSTAKHMVAMMSFFPDVFASETLSDNNFRSMKTQNAFHSQQRCLLSSRQTSQFCFQLNTVQNIISQNLSRSGFVLRLFGSFFIFFFAHFFFLFIVSFLSFEFYSLVSRDIRPKVIRHSRQLRVQT